jgi:hypothetical protein
MLRGSNFNYSDGAVLIRPQGMLGTIWPVTSI